MYIVKCKYVQKMQSKG